MGLLHRDLFLLNGNRRFFWWNVFGIVCIHRFPIDELGKKTIERRFQKVTQFHHIELLWHYNKILVKEAPNMIMFLFVEDNSEIFLLWMFFLIILRRNSIDQNSVPSFWFNIYLLHPHQQLYEYVSYPIVYTANCFLFCHYSVIVDFEWEFFMNYKSQVLCLLWYWYFLVH